MEVDGPGLGDVVRVSEGSRPRHGHGAGGRADQGPPLGWQTREGVAHIVVDGVHAVDKVGRSRDHKFLFPLDQSHCVRDAGLRMTRLFSLTTMTEERRLTGARAGDCLALLSASCHNPAAADMKQWQQ